MKIFFVTRSFFLSIALIFFLSLLCVIFVPFEGVSSAATLHYQEILSQALSIDYDYQQAKIEKQIKQKSVQEAKWGLWPEISLKVNSEFVQNLGHDSSVTAVGDSVFSDQTQYQNYAYFDFSYELIDYGVMRKKVKNAEIEAMAASYQLSKIRMDIEKELLNLYANLLIGYKEKAYRERTLKVRQQLVGLVERFADAGIEDKLGIAESLIDIEEERDLIAKLEYDMQRLLVDISYYTGEQYSFDGLSVGDFDFQINELNRFDFKRHPEYKYYELQYEIKKNEIDIVKRNYLPKIDFYARYTYFGADEENYLYSLEALRDREFSIGIFTSIPLVENIKRQQTLARVKLEATKSKLQMQKVQAVISRDFQKLELEYNFYMDDIARARHLLELTQNKDDMVDRLAKAKVMDQKSALEQKLALIERAKDLEKKIVNSLAAVKQIMIQIEEYK